MNHSPDFENSYAEMISSVLDCEFAARERAMNKASGKLTVAMARRIAEEAKRNGSIDVPGHSESITYAERLMIRTKRSVSSYIKQMLESSPQGLLFSEIKNRLPMREEYPDDHIQRSLQMTLNKAEKRKELILVCKRQLVKPGKLFANLGEQVSTKSGAHGKRRAKVEKYLRGKGWVPTRELAEACFADCVDPYNRAVSYLNKASRSDWVKCRDHNREARLS